MGKGTGKSGSRNGAAAAKSVVKEEEKNIDEAEILKSIPQTVKREEISGYEHMSDSQLKEEARRITATRMFNAGILSPSIMGQLESDNYSNAILDTAVSRGWISKIIRDFIRKIRCTK